MSGKAESRKGKPRVVRAPLSPQERAEVIAALLANPSAKQVAQEFGLDYGVVWRTANHAGIDLCAGRAARAKRSGQVTRFLYWNQNVRSRAGEVVGDPERGKT
jgi:hypothetical protein